MIQSNLRSGLFAGLVFAGIYIAYAVGHTIVFGLGPVHEVGFTLLGLIATYLLAGILGGLTMGVFWPLRRHLAGSLFLGVVVGGISAVCIEIGRGSRFNEAESLVQVLAIGGFVGILCGFFLWLDSR